MRSRRSPLRFFGDPASELTLIGVTGTNGKTSTTFLVESILAAAGLAVGLIGTVEVRYAGERRRALNTTPESLELQRLLRDMRTQGVDAAVMEVSSHGLALGRVAGCRFDVAALTNLTQDHLDFHGDMEAYAEAKALLFREHLKPGGVAVVNLDEPARGPLPRRGARRRRAHARRHAPAGRRRRGAGRVRRSVALRRRGAPQPAVRPARRARSRWSATSTSRTWRWRWASPSGSALAPERIARGVAGCPQVPGRMERVGATAPGAPVVLVDYAHTPDAVEKLLRAVRPLTTGRADRGVRLRRRPRPQQAAADGRGGRALRGPRGPHQRQPAHRGSRGDPARGRAGGLATMRRVAPEGLAGADRGLRRVRSTGARRSSWRSQCARPGDTVVIAGKGHEDYQIIGRERLPFDDREEARRALRRRAS